MEIVNIISVVIGLIASIWALADPQNGPLRYLRPVKKSEDGSSTGGETSKISKPASDTSRGISLLTSRIKPKKNPPSPKTLFRHLILLVFAYVLFIAADFLLRLFYHRHDIAISPYYPKDLLDVASIKDYYDGIVVKSEIPELVKPLWDAPFSEVLVVHLFYVNLIGFFYRMSTDLFRNIFAVILAELYLFIVYTLIVFVSGGLALFLVNLFVELNVSLIATYQAGLLILGYFLFPLFIYLIRSGIFPLPVSIDEYIQGK